MWAREQTMAMDPAVYGCVCIDRSALATFFSRRDNFWSDWHHHQLTEADGHDDEKISLGDFMSASREYSVYSEHRAGRTHYSVTDLGSCRVSPEKLTRSYDDDAQLG